MAQRLRSFDFTAQSAITSAESKGRNRYPWDDWFDGDIWKITQGSDFNTSPLMMERIIRTRASNKNHKARVTLRHLPGLDGEAPAIVLQRLDIEGPSVAKKAEQAQRRAEKKATAEAEALQTLAAAGIAPVVKNGSKPTKAVNGVKKAVSKTPAKKAPAVKRKLAAASA